MTNKSIVGHGQARHTLHELVAQLLVAVLVMGSLPVPAQAVQPDQAAAAAGGAAAPPLPSVVPPPASAPEVEVNRRVPAVDPVPAYARLGASPDRETLTRARVFSEPLLAVGGEPTTEENHALARAIEAYQRRGQIDDSAPFEDLLAQRTLVAWRPSLLVNLGLVYERTGRFTRAQQAFEQAWELAKASREQTGRTVADRALGELLWVHSLFGRENKLRELLAQADGRDVRGSAAERVHDARLEAWGLANRHHEAVPSGPLALSQLLRFTRAGRWDDPRLLAFHATPDGASVKEMRDLAAELGLEMRMAYREPGAALLFPAVMHFRGEHFSALLGQARGRYRLADPLLGGELWLSAQALEEEASGYFLVPAEQPLPAGWREVGEREADAVRGRCLYPLPRSSESCCHNSGGDGGGSGNGGGGGNGGGRGNRRCPGGNCGMARYTFQTLVAGVQVSDTPVGYQPPVGPGVWFQVTYKQRDPFQPGSFSYSNLGRRWSHAFMGWIEDDPSNPWAMAYAYRPGGGREDYQDFDGQAYAPAWRSRAVVRRVSSSPIVYEREAPDGSKEVYAQADGAMTAPRRVFLTQVIDAQGNALALTYDSQLRLVAITDALGQVTTLSYEHPDPLKITRVSDPFGRQAHFEYDASGYLAKITDVIGITSQFEYGAQDFMRALTTPYGTTRFRSGFEATASIPGGHPDEARWWVEATDPLGGKERIEYSDMPTPIPASDPAASVPTGFGVLNVNLNTRNSFYWSKRAMALAPGDYTAAHVTHWLWQGAYVIYHPVVSDTKHSEKAPLEGRVWYDYIEENAPQTRSTFDRPVKVARVLDDGASQVYRYEYNDTGHVTRASDPVGRTTLYEYDTNGVDLVAVRQVNGAGTDLLASITHRPTNPPHRPATVTDASGQTTTYTYDARGRLTTIETPPRNGPSGTPLTQAERTTTYAYYADNAPVGAARVQSITGPSTSQGASVTSFTYDGYGRVRATTDSDAYALTFDYDALDRTTRVAYPDGTYEETVYNRLDPHSQRDRLGRWSHAFHDALGRVVSTRDPLGRTITQQWCNCGSLDKLIDANGNATTWERDVQGRVTREIRADGKDRLFVYESTTSRLKEEHDFMTPRQVKSYEYFTDGALKHVSYANAVVATPPVSYTYDPVYSRLATMTDGIGTTTYAYNAITTPATLGAAQLASVDGPLSDDTVSYTYDELGRIASRGLSAFSSSFKYDALGRLVRQVSPVGSFTSTYDGVTARALSLAYPNGQTTTYSYFPNSGDHRLQEIEHRDPGASLLSKFAYTYDAVGNIKTWTQQYAPDPATVYELGYDAADQLTAATLKSTDPTPATLKRYGYAYDPAGNRTTEQIDDAATAASYNKRNQLLATQAGGALVVRGSVSEPATVTVQGQPATVTPAPANRFDGQAQTTAGATTVTVQAIDPSGNTRTNTYDVTQTGATTTYTHDANGNLTSDGTKTYVWDAENHLVEVRQGPAILAGFVYDGLGRRARKTLAGVTHTYVSDESSIIEERVSTGRTLRHVDGLRVDQHLAVLDGPTATYYLADRLGSIVQETSSSGAVTLARRYDLWGNQVSPLSAAGYAFTGREWDSEVGLAYYRARYYDPRLGRFISEDPIGFAGGENFFGYVGNEPTNATDPRGLQARRTQPRPKPTPTPKPTPRPWTPPYPNVPPNTAYYICCLGGQMGVCEGPAAPPNTPDSEPVRACMQAHEQQHCNDFDSGRYPSNRYQCGAATDGAPVHNNMTNAVECDGYCRELVCLEGREATPRVADRIREITEFHMPPGCRCRS